MCSMGLVNFCICMYSLLYYKPKTFTFILSSALKCLLRESMIFLGFFRQCFPEAD